MSAVLHRKRITESVIILFCLWHMTAVAAFVTTPNATTPFASAINRAKDITKPYTLLLSQWQYWNIFAPDPLQRSSTYHVEMMTPESRWQTVRVLDYKTLAWHERAKELKILENLEDNWRVLVPSYLQTFCRSLRLQPGSTLQLKAISYVLPTGLQLLRHSAALELSISENVLGTTVCTTP